MSLEPTDLVYLDASFLTGLFVKNHEFNDRCQRKFAELMTSETQFFTSTLALDEFWHAIKVEADSLIRRKNGRVGNFIGCVRKCLGLRYVLPALTSHSKHVRAYREAAKLLEDSGAQIAEYRGSEYEGIKKAIDNIEQLRLQPRDAVHLSIMQHRGLNKVIAKDRRSFGRLPANGGIKLEDY